MRYAQEKVRPYRESAKDKDAQVTLMFNRIAPTYDRLNRILSLGLDRIWRQKAIRALACQDPGSILDLATGTGDFAMLLAEAFPKARILGADLSQGMMEEAAKKARLRHLEDRVHFLHMDSADLSLSDESVDAVTITFGYRNFSHLDRAMRECLRVLRKGGMLIILELSAPANPIVSLGFRIYARTLMSLVGWAISHDGSAYTYLPRSIRACVQGEEMAGVLRRAGFSQASHTALSMGLCTLYTARKGPVEP